MLAKTFSAAVIGIDAYMVEVEINATGSGEQDFGISGLPFSFCVLNLYYS